MQKFISGNMNINKVDKHNNAVIIIKDLGTIKI